MTTIFLKDDIKRMIELCNSDLWPPKMKVDIKDADIAALPEQKLIWVEYSPEVCPWKIVRLVSTIKG